MTKEIREAQKRHREINAAHKSSAVKVRGLKGEIIFECTGPMSDDCSVLVVRPDGTKKREFVKLDAVTFPEAEAEDAE